MNRRVIFHSWIISLDVNKEKYWFLLEIADTVEDSVFV